MLVKFMQARRDAKPGNRFDFVPASFGSELYRQYNRFVKTEDKSAFIFSNLSIVPFITRPKWFQEVDVVYLPMQIERQHWIGVVIYLPSWQIIVLDCNKACLSEQQIKMYLEHLAFMLPYLIRKHGISAATHSLRMDPMTIMRPTIPYHCTSRGMQICICL